MNDEQENDIYHKNTRVHTIPNYVNVDIYSITTRVSRDIQIIQTKMNMNAKSDMTKQYALTSKVPDYQSRGLIIMDGKY